MGEDLLLYQNNIFLLFSKKHFTQIEDWSPAPPQNSKLPVFMCMLFVSFPCPLEMRFKGGHHHSSKTCLVLKLRRLAKVNIQMHNTVIQDQNTGSIAAIRYIRYVTEYESYNRAPFQSTCSFAICKIITTNVEAKYPGSEYGIYGC